MLCVLQGDNKTNSHFNSVPPIFFEDYCNILYHKKYLLSIFIYTAIIIPENSIKLLYITLFKTKYIYFQGWDSVDLKGNLCYNFLVGGTPVIQNDL